MAAELSLGVRLAGLCYVQLASSYFTGSFWGGVLVLSDFPWFKKSPHAVVFLIPIFVIDYINKLY